MLSNRRHGYKEIKGEVRFGSMNEAEAQQYRGKIVMNTEDELFFPVLTVGQTIDFSTRMRMPAQTPSDFATPDEYRNAVKKFILETLGIAYTSNTMVGNEFIRGVSGGERKRLSIAEVFSTEASVYCWDNSTRGLDASTALDWARSLRAMTDILGLTTVVTLYQAGNGIFNLFDKVLVLDGGKEIYYRPREEARPYMESLGFVCDNGSNVGDFLTGVTVPTERQVRPENLASFPRNAEEIEAIYNKSGIKMRMDKKSDYSTRQSTLFDTQQFQEAMAERKSKSLSQGSPFTVSFGQQVMTLTIRQYQLLWGDNPSLLMRHASTLIQALLAGSLFYDAPANSNGLFIKGGVLFWSTLYHCLVAMSETITTFFGRPILAKHKEFAFYHPAAFCLAQIVADIPGLVFQVTLWAVIVYWMAALRATADAFFTYWVVILAITFCMTAFFRLCGAAFPTFDAASKISGFVINAIATYTGFMISKPESHTSSNTSSTVKTETNFKNNPNDSEFTGKPLLSNTSVFTWKNLSYTVKTHHGDRKLLDNVSGWAKPGMLGALMGSSGAGETTLMDVLAQRKTEGTITGSVLVDGRELPVSFQRSAGYCEQFDVHEPFSTVREALEFSALLRQSRERPDVEKLAYVDTVIDLLELRNLEHSLVGRPGAGLTIEQHKRVSIGVELVAKPSILIFLDEPTSGLDGQAAAQTFSQFDTLLFLGKGGKTVYFGDIGPDAATLKGYFAQHGAPCPPSANPAEHMIDVVSGTSSNQDWHHLWLDSPEHKQSITDLDNMIQTASSKSPATKDDGHEFAASMITQTRIVTHLMNTALYRNTDYIMNKIMLHVVSGLFNGFTFWKIGNNIKDLQNTLFAIFNFIFVAPGVVAQLQPVFIDRRDIFEIREKKSKTYHWASFVTGLIVSEIPYLIVSGFFYFVTFNFTVGFPTDANKAGGVFFVVIMYEFLYTGIGQFIAAYAPNAIFASMVNPLIISTMISFCGVLVPYSELQAFWRYWIYYLNPFTYLMGSLINFALFDKTIECTDSELAIFNPPANESCGEFLFIYLQGPGSGSNLLNPNATSDCRVCQYASGTDYLYTLNVKNFYYAWRDAAIVVIFVLSSYGLVYGFMKLRTKATKKAQ
ncbi:hypothetical protein ACKRZS_006944 [Fusarium odoratissimum]